MAEKSRAKKRSGQKINAEFFYDYSLLFVVFFLLGFGLVMVYSASSYEALQSKKDAAYYFKRQLIADILGVIAMMIAANFPYKIWEKLCGFIYLAAIGLIFLIIPFGNGSRGAKRWIGIPGTSFNIQPAEVAKIGVILLGAYMICKIGKNVKTIKGFLFMMGIPLFPAVLIRLITNNMSSAIIVMAIVFVMVFVASPNYKEYVIMALVAAALVAVLVLVVSKQMENGTISTETGSFRFGRIVAWLDPESQVQDKGFQTTQGLYAIGSGGVWGKGLGRSMQKLSFLPEAQNDMIFSIICEELGLFGAISIIIMFIILLWRMMIIANNASDLFGALIVVGVMSHIAIQTILNIAVVTNFIPNTGVSLPFISYGGSSVIFLLGEVGIVLNVAKKIELKA